MVTRDRGPLEQKPKIRGRPFQPGNPSRSLRSKNRARLVGQTVAGESRPNNSVVRSLTRKRPNALKDGFYTKTVTLPGEDLCEFEELCADLIEEWKPSGPTLRDAAFGLADLMWKMRRLRKNTQTKVVLTRYDLRNPAFDEAWGLLRFTACLRSEPEIEEPETCFEQKESSYLRPDKIDYLP
jgi:hypothetical protein